MRLLNRRRPSQNRFVLGASGHIAGVINPPQKNKRHYWRLPAAGRVKPDAASWLQAAVEQPGSWWPEWRAFLAAHAGKQVRAPAQYGNRRYRMIEAAPGRYVKARA